MIKYLTLGETIALRHYENALSHLRRSSFHFMCGKFDWASKCIAKANKDFNRAVEAREYYQRHGLIRRDLQ